MSNRNLDPERLKNEMRKKESASPQSMKMMVKKVKMAMKRKGKISKFQRDIVNVHEEYRRRHPTNYRRQKLVEDAYNNTFLIFLKKSPNVLTKYEDGQRMTNLLRRWGTPCPELQDFLRNNPRPGDILKQRSQNSINSYELKVNIAEQDFVNVSRKQMFFDMGTTHVSIGFCDLSEFLYCRLMNTGTSKPLRFIGYDSSLFCVTKTKIIVEMMKLKCSIKSIAEVWWSSGWSKRTLKDFEKGIDQLLLLPERLSSENENLLHLLYHLKKRCSKAISRKKFEKMWFEDLRTISLSPAFSLERNRDRMEFLDYILSGNLFFDHYENNEIVFGSITMFDRPPSLVSKRSLGQSFFQVIDFPTLKITDPKKISLLNVCRDSLLSNVKKVSQSIQDHQITVEVFQKFISEKNIKENVTSLKPYTMNWSNILDYQNRDQFIRMAKKCSTPETLHFAHSMNWIRNVYGMDLHDYPPQMRPILVEKIDSTFELSYKNTMGIQRFGEYFKKEAPPTNIKNIASWSLMFQYLDLWKDFFFQGMGTLQVFPNDEFYNVFARSDLNLNITFSFSKLTVNPMIKKNGETVSSRQLLVLLNVLIVEFLRIRRNLKFVLHVRWYFIAEELVK